MVKICFSISETFVFHTLVLKTKEEKDKMRQINPLMTNVKQGFVESLQGNHWWKQKTEANS